MRLGLLVHGTSLSKPIQCHQVNEETAVRQCLCRIQFYGLAEFARGPLVLCQSPVLNSQHAMWPEVARIALLPKFAVLDDLIRLLADVLMEDGSDFKFLAFTGAVAQCEGLAKWLYFAVVLS